MLVEKNISYYLSLSVKINFFQIFLNSIFDCTKFADHAEIDSQIKKKYNLTMSNHYGDAIFIDFFSRLS